MDYLEKKAYAKINISLDVTGKRDDGYHLVSMVMQSIGIYDSLRFMRSSEPGIRLHSEKAAAGVVMDETNLIYKAAKRLFDEYRIDGGVDITLKKNIPVAAGLAGGSTDAACTLIGINEMLELGIRTGILMDIGASIGADVPYCIMGGTALAEGIGEKLTRLSPFPKAYIVLAKPERGVSTAEVYRAIDSMDIPDDKRPDNSRIIKGLDAGSLSYIAGNMKNVLQLVTEPMVPEIRELITIMKDSGAVNAMMSGSGPSTFGLFTDEEPALKAVEEIKRSGLAKDVFLTEPVNAV